MTHMNRAAMSGNYCKGGNLKKGVRWRSCGRLDVLTFLKTRLIPIQNQSAIFLGSFSAPQRTICTPPSPMSSPP